MLIEKSHECIMGYMEVTWSMHVRVHVRVRVRVCVCVRVSRAQARWGDRS